MRALVIPALLLCLLGEAACSSAGRPIDWASARQEGRVQADTTELRNRLDETQHYWTDGGAQLLVVEEGGGLARSRRLILQGYGAGRVQTPFLVDTGSSGSMLSASSALGREAVVYEKSHFKVLQGKPAQGYLGTLPELNFGTMSRRDVVIGIVEREHTLEDPVNVLGLPDFFHAQLEHKGGRWFLRSQAKRLPPREAGWLHVPMVRGYPLGTREDPRGQAVFGLIDTGAPTRFAVTPSPRGAYRLRAEDGSVAMEILVSRTVGWRGLNLEGRKISVLIGMDALGARDGRFTFNQAVWSMAPIQTASR